MVVSKVMGLRVLSGPHEGEFFPVIRFPCLIGRKLGGQVALFNDDWVSSEHCKLDLSEGVLVLMDQGSTNGTFVDGERVSSPVTVSPHKSTISLGRSVLQVVNGDNASEEETEQVEVASALTAGSLFLNKSGMLNEDRVLETLFVVDVVNSTQLANEYGDQALLKLVNLLGRILMTSPEKDLYRFIKCTGDGYFVTFDSTETALLAGCRVLYNMRKLEDMMPDLLYPGLRIGIHRGLVTVDPTGDRLGLPCHLAFRLEGTSSPNLATPPKKPLELPERDRILMTDEALMSMMLDLRDMFEHAGDYNFKGFDYAVRVNLLSVDVKDAYSRLSNTSGSISI